MNNLGNLLDQLFQADGLKMLLDPIAKLMKAFYKYFFCEL